MALESQHPRHSRRLNRSGDISWTNPSVRALAGDQNPIATIEDHARRVVLDALDKGWSGPPFDPIELADILRIAVQPRSDVLDARTVPTGAAGFTIEFNPRLSRERLRFSIAHEIAHTFFPDCAKAVRHRGGRDHSREDDWQLEMLCNIAASEIVMPLADAMRTLSGPTTIEHLMRLRTDFEVSSEAILIRMAKVTDEPLFVFCASRVQQDHATRFRIDYAIPSRNYAQQIPTGEIIATDTVLRECTAIGFTARRAERWPRISSALEVECVGLPPYPGAEHLRVAGLARLAGVRSAPPQQIQYLYGDAISPRGTGPRLICHIVNDGAYTWGGAGFAANLRRRHPAVQQEFREWAQGASERLRLGNVHFSRISDSIEVASMVAQRGFRPAGKPLIRYAALERCLDKVVQKARNEGLSIHMPRIGTGAAGGSWPVVEAILIEKVLAQGIPITVYDLPQKGNSAIQRGLFSDR